MDEEPRITVASTADIPDVLTLYHHLSPDDAPAPLAAAESVHSAIAAIPGSATFLCRVGGIAVSSCTIFILPNLSRRGMPYALIENVVTHSNYRKRGLGTAILHHAITHAFDVGCYKVMLMTGTSSQSTLDFYARAGFEQTKTGFQIRNSKVLSA